MIKPIMTTLVRPRIGIYAGTFDPVHAGHIAFAVQALRAADLDQVVFLPERRPRQNPGATHYAHRVAMIAKALRPHPDLAVLETVERQCTVGRSLPSLRLAFPDADLVWMFGSDVAMTLPDWPLAHRLLRDCELVVGVLLQQTVRSVRSTILSWPVSPKRLRVLDSYASGITSFNIRQALSRDVTVEGLLCSVHAYARREWLYVSPSAMIR